MMEVKKQKKKKLSMIIPDEDACLTQHLSQMRDCVGPQSSRHSSNRNKIGIWGDNNSQIKSSKFSNLDASCSED